MKPSEFFGQLLKDYRVKAGLTLREFAGKADYDVSNLSKIERGLLPPPPGNLIIRKWARILGLSKNSHSYQELLDTAVVSRTLAPNGVPPKDLARYLPAFYRTLRNRHKDKESYLKLIELLKKS